MDTTLNPTNYTFFDKVLALLTQLNVISLQRLEQNKLF